jgi:hypothetical protein
MSTKVFYALVWTICGAVFQLILFFSGFQTEKLETGKYLQWLGLVIAAVVLWLGIKAVRDEKPDRPLGYGQRLGAGVMISLYAGLMSGVYAWFHYRFINVSFADYTINSIRAGWAAKGLSASQMDQAEKFTRNLLTPEAQAVLSPVMAVIIGTVLSLIIAALLAPKAAASDAAPPAS